MKMRVQLIIEDASGASTCADIAAIERHTDDLIGLSLEEAKAMTGAVQRSPHRALQTLEDLTWEIGTESEHAKAMLQNKIEEFMGYVTANLMAIPNYADRHRHGEPIATGFVESAVNQVVSKRFVKKQQMRWTPTGAHHLLQVRTRALNQQLRGDFERWYPRLRSGSDSVRLAA